MDRSLSPDAWFMSSFMLSPTLNGKVTVTRFLGLLLMSGSVQGIPQRSALASYCSVLGQFTSTISIQNEFCLVLPPRRSSMGVIKVVI